MARSVERIFGQRDRDRGQRRPAADRCFAGGIDSGDRRGGLTRPGFGRHGRPRVQRRLWALSKRGRDDASLDNSLSPLERATSPNAASGSSPCWLVSVPAFASSPCLSRPRRTRKQGATEGHHSRSRASCPLCFSPSASAPVPISYPLVTMTLPGPRAHPTTWAVLRLHRRCSTPTAHVPGAQPSVWTESRPTVWTAVCSSRPPIGRPSDAAISADGGSSAHAEGHLLRGDRGSTRLRGASQRAGGVRRRRPICPGCVPTGRISRRVGRSLPAAPGLVEHPVRNTFVWYRRTSGLEVKRGSKSSASPAGHRRPSASIAWRRRCRRPTTTWPWPSLTSTSARRRAHSTACPSRSSNYFQAVNEHDYRYAWQQFSPREQAQFSVSQLAAGISSVQDFGIGINSIRLVRCSDGRRLRDLRQHTRRKPGARWRHLGQLDARLPDGQSGRPVAHRSRRTSQRLHTHLAVRSADRG